MTILLLCALAALLVAAPVVAGVTGYSLSAGSSILMTASGIALFVLTGILLVVTRLYHRTRASEAFVRTGAGGVKVIRDGGAIVVPFIHELMKVSLETIKMEVERAATDALITHDKLRADICAEFFVRVQPERESILQASRSLGDRMSNAAAVKELIEDKLVSALRTAAASKTLEQLNSERDDFLAEVTRLVTEDLRSNGLILETATISKLDQTDEQYLKAENIFDAQGRRKIAEITQQNLTERNRLVRAGEQARKEQDVMTRQELLEYERAQREAEARQAAAIAKAEADAARDAQEQRLIAERQVELANVDKQKTIELAARLQQQAVEVAEREKQEQIALADKKRAAAERALAEALAERETARQAIETVRVTEEARRAKNKQVIDAEALAEQRFVGEQRKADAEAYALRTQAEARKLSADAEAVAVRTKAQAEAEAARQHADGLKANAMVPVEVKKAEVALDRERLETVIKPELEAREEHGRVAQDFELAQLRISADREVRIAIANASATLFSRVEANLFGTPADVARMNESFLKGQSVARGLGGFMAALDESTVTAASALKDNLEKVAESVAAKLAPKKDDELIVEDEEVLEEAS